MREFVVHASDGRQLAAAETGDSDGVPVVFHHGTPGNRMAHNLTPPALVGARVIVYDRPGYGGSDPHPGRDVAACAADTAAIVDSLGITSFSVFGSSGGGPHALACGALLAERVSRVAVVAGFAPADDPSFDFYAGMSDLNIGELLAAADGEAQLRRLLTEFVEATGGDADAAIDEITSELSQADQSALSRPEVRAVFREAIGASFGDGLSGWIDDDLAFMSPWGFELEQITQPTLLMQGEFDLLVPRGHMAHIASRIPTSKLQIISGGGHTLFDETRDLVAWAIADS